jgi:hypothetical protein
MHACSAFLPSYRSGDIGMALFDFFSKHTLDIVSELLYPDLMISNVMATLFLFCHCKFVAFV